MTDKNIEQIENFIIEQWDIIKRTSVKSYIEAKLKRENIGMSCTASQLTLADNNIKEAKDVLNHSVSKIQFFMKYVNIALNEKQLKKLKSFIDTIPTVSCLGETITPLGILRRVK